MAGPGFMRVLLLPLLGYAFYLDVLSVRAGSAFPRERPVLAGILTRVAFDPIKPPGDPLGHIRFLPDSDPGFLLHGGTLDDGHCGVRRAVR